VKIITINLPEKYLSAIQTLNNFGLYPSRSEAIRVALSDFLSKELEFEEDISPAIFEPLARGRRYNH